MGYRFPPHIKCTLLLRVLLVLGLVLGSVQPVWAATYAEKKGNDIGPSVEARSSHKMGQTQSPGDLGRMLALSVSGPEEVTPGEESR